MMQKRRPPVVRSAATLLAGLIALLCAAGAASGQTAADLHLQGLTAELLPRVEALSGLEALRPIHVSRRGREEFQAVLAARMQEEAAMEEIRSVERVYKRLGLIPASLDLTDVAGALLGEQIAGYFDPRTDTLYVLGDVPPGELRATLAHEIVHALQDQHFDLESLVAPERGGDRQMAARAAIEGHAMLVMWLLSAEEETGRLPPLDELPDMSLAPLDLFFPDGPLPALASAPLVLREGMVFPYARGAGFVQALWRREPGAPPFGDLLPQSTEQVLDPEGRFLTRRDPPIEILIGDEVAGGASGVEVAAEYPARGSAGAPRGSAVGANAPSANDGPWRVDYEGTLGQFELSLLLRERHVRFGADRYAIGWAGDRYQLLTDGERDVVVWYIAWDDGPSAFQFASAYRQILGMRLNRSGSVDELTVDGRSVVRIVEADEGVDLSALPRPPLRLSPERN